MVMLTIGSPVRRFLHRLQLCPFTLVGAGTLAYWVLVENGILPYGPIFRILVIPMYAMGLLIAAVRTAIWGPEPQPATDRAIDLLAMVLLLTPYVLLDLFARWLLRARHASASNWLRRDATNMSDRL